MEYYWWIAIAVVVVIIGYMIYNNNKTDVPVTEAEVAVVDTIAEQPTEPVVDVPVVTDTTTTVETPDIETVTFTFYGLADNDYLIQPRVSYKFSDNFSTNLGANFFGGVKDETFLGQFDKNDNTYLSVSFDF